MVRMRTTAMVAVLLTAGLLGAGAAEAGPNLVGKRLSGELELKVSAEPDIDGKTECDLRIKFRRDSRYRGRMKCPGQTAFSWNGSYFQQDRKLQLDYSEAFVFIRNTLEAFFEDEGDLRSVTAQLDPLPLAKGRIEKKGGDLRLKTGTITYRIGGFGDDDRFLNTTGKMKGSGTLD